jgi:protocatechuate 3,4-dioxygenase alpha subunit
MVFMRGLLSHAYTRLYFSDEEDANARDPVLASVPEARRASLIAKREDLDGRAVYRFDIRMQGDDETVFFDV